MSEPGERPVAGILDTSTLLLLGKISNAASLPTEPLITAVTLGELAVGPLVALDEGERARRQAQLQQAEADFAPLPFDAEAARAFGQVSASLRRSGRKAAARAYDAMVAAIALANDLPVYTCNPDDFSGIEGLEVVAVPVPH
ncbi:MAG TPA: type II toxin-antitoxin system VapC family toxin [Solirubrobacterales bacterium]|nr:type II toxin-antitoxin system VapC family toxin [Solirubrobacterales bacterium]